MNNPLSAALGRLLRRVNVRAAATVRQGRAPNLCPVAGVVDVVTKDSHVPVRIFYPSEAQQQGDVGWFIRGFPYFIDGYLHTLVAWLRDSTAAVWALTVLSYLLACIIPMGNAFLPSCAYSASPAAASKGRYPLILFSHGLTGSGEEHALLFAHWARKGYVVASVHHCDGSSAKVPRADDYHLLYEHPNMEKYDKDFRPRQIQRREQELYEGLQYVLHDGSFPSSIRSIIDESSVIVGGFSYGAATAALSITKHRDAYCASLLMDGWFYIDLEPAFAFPAEAHSKGLHIPALFIGSEHFANWKTCAKATSELAKKNTAGSECYVLQGSRHQNFTDIGFWLPLFLLRKVNMIGSCDYDAKYNEILDLSVSFFELHTKTGDKVKSDRE